MHPHFLAIPIIQINRLFCSLRQSTIMDGAWGVTITLGKHVHGWNQAKLSPDRFVGGSRMNLIQLIIIILMPTSIHAGQSGALLVVRNFVGRTSIMIGIGAIAAMNLIVPRNLAPAILSCANSATKNTAQHMAAIAANTLYAIIAGKFI